MGLYRDVYNFGANAIAAIIGNTKISIPILIVYLLLTEKYLYKIGKINTLLT
jgi:hypothetical protein